MPRASVLPHWWMKRVPRSRRSAASRRTSSGSRGTFTRGSRDAPLRIRWLRCDSDGSRTALTTEAREAHRGLPMAVRKSRSVNKSVPCGERTGHHHANVISRAGGLGAPPPSPWLMLSRDLARARGDLGSGSAALCLSLGLARSRRNAPEHRVHPHTRFPPVTANRRSWPSSTELSLRRT